MNAARLDSIMRHHSCVGVAALILTAAVFAPCSISSASDPAPELTQRVFSTPAEAANALIDAAGTGDMEAMAEIFGPDGIDLVATEDPIHDRNQAARLAEEARIQASIVQDLTDPATATLIVGPDDWPLPIPIVADDGAWRFDTEAGREEILYRRIGANELDAIQVCHGFVEAQYDYAYKKRHGMTVAQFAQRIISTPGTHDGLAWRDPDGCWHGPVGEAIAEVIAEGYTERFTPFHGYYYKVLKGQGPSAPLGEMDFVVDGVMIGGFALAAAPADYGVTGVMSFIVSHDGIVYEADLGLETLDQFQAMERYNPDEAWTPVDVP